jgi:hypothetical protein
MYIHTHTYIHIYVCTYTYKQIWSDTSTQPTRCIHTLNIFEHDEVCGNVIALRTTGALFRTNSDSDSYQYNHGGEGNARKDSHDGAKIDNNNNNNNNNGAKRGEHGAKLDHKDTCVDLYMIKPPAYVVIASEAGPVAIYTAYTWRVIAHVTVREDVTRADRLTSCIFLTRKLMMFCYAVSNSIYIYSIYIYIYIYT